MTGGSLTTTLGDYLLPLTADVPRVEIQHCESPTPSTPLGSKGVGEAGTIGAFGAVPNAVGDALAPSASSCPACHTRPSGSSPPRRGLDLYSGNIARPRCTGASNDVPERPRRGLWSYSMTKLLSGQLLVAAGGQIANGPNTRDLSDRCCLRCTERSGAQQAQTPLRPELRAVAICSPVHAGPDASG